MAGQPVLFPFTTTLHSPGKFRPVHLRYLSYDPAKDVFISLLDKGDNRDIQTADLRDITAKLMEYFFTGISLPDSAFWVNLRPDGEDDIIDADLARTDIGKILLEADLELKKDVALSTSPNTPEGKEYWDRLYDKAGELWGQTEGLEIPALTRPWIVPGEIIIRETAESLYIYKATLKVMFEQDYLYRPAIDSGAGKNSTTYDFVDQRSKELNEYSTQLLRELVIPKISRLINADKRYAALRQVYYSLILAQWFKKHCDPDRARGNTLSGGYGVSITENQLVRRMNSKDLTSLTSKTAWSKTAYFKAYTKSFQNGEYNFQKRMTGLYGAKIIQYFSGGMDFSDVLPGLNSGQAGAAVTVIKGNPFNRLTVGPELKVAEISGAAENGQGFTISIMDNVLPLLKNNSLDGGKTDGDSAEVRRVDSFGDGGSATFGAIGSAAVRLDARNNSVWSSVAAQAGIAGLVLVIAVITALVSSSPFWVGLILPATVPFFAVLTIPHFVSWLAQKSEKVKEHKFLVTAELMLGAVMALNLLTGSGIAFFEPMGWFWHHAAEVWLNNSFTLPEVGGYFRASVLGLMFINAGLFAGGKDGLSHTLMTTAGKTVLATGAVGSAFMVIMSLAGFPGLLAIPYVIEVLAITAGASVLVPEMISGRALSASPKTQPPASQNKVYKEAAQETMVVAAAIFAGNEVKGNTPRKHDDTFMSDPIEYTPESLLKQWDAELTSRDGLFAADRLPTILNIAKHLINYSVLSKELVSQKNKMEEAYAITQRLTRLSAKTVEALLEEWRNNGLSPVDKERITYAVRYLIDIAKYSSEFEHALHAAAITTAMSNYYLPDSEWSERFMMMPVVRSLWGMRYSLKRSGKEFFSQFDKVAALGNNIEPHLYLQAEKKKQEIDGYFKSLNMSKTKENRFKVQQEFGGKREMSSRFYPLVLALWPFLSGILFILGLPLGVSLNPVGILTGLVTGLGVSIGLSWWHIRESFIDDFYNLQVNNFRALDSEFQRMAYSKDAAVSGSAQEGLIRKGWNSALSAFAREMNAVSPSADVVFVLTGSDPANQKRLRSIYSREISGIIRKDVPVILVSSEGEGSGNAMLDLYAYKHSEEFKQIKNANTRLKGITVERMRSVVLLGTRNVSNEPLPGGPVSLLNRSVKLFEFQIMNGYRGTQELQSRGRQGEIIIFTDGLYIGDIRPMGDITFLGSWMSQKQIQIQKFGLILADIRGGSRIRKFYEKMDFATIRNKLELASLRRYFDWSNPDKEQFLGFAGGLVVSFQDEQRYERFIGLMRTAKEHIAASKVLYPVHLALDILVPLIMLSNNEKIFTYFGTIHDNGNGKKVGDEEREFYHRLFESYAAAYKTDKQWFNLRAYIPFPGETEYVRMDGTGFQKEKLAELAAILDKIDGATKGIVLSGGPEVTPELQPRLDKPKRLQLIKGFFNEPRNAGKEFSVAQVSREVHGNEDRLWYARTYGDLEVLSAAGILSKHRSRDSEGYVRNYYSLQVTGLQDGGRIQVGPAVENPGGIDFRSLLVNGFIDGRGTGFSARIPEIIGWKQIERDVGFKPIQVLLRCAVVPSKNLVQGYLGSLSCLGRRSQYASMSVFCISEILRLEEESAVAADPEFINVLVNAERSSPVMDLQAELSRPRLFQLN